MQQFSNPMKVFLFVLTLFSISIYADDKQVLEDLLHDFLSGQTEAHHQRFWADDLIYTSSSGTRFDKAFIMQGFKNDKENEDDTDAKTTAAVTYSATDVDIRVYEDMAIVAFKLVATQGEDVIQTYWNTGTFAQRAQGWQAIAWQATKIPKAEQSK